MTVWTSAAWKKHKRRAKNDGRTGLRSRHSALRRDIAGAGRPLARSGHDQCRMQPADPDRRCLPDPAHYYRRFDVGIRHAVFRRPAQCFPDCADSAGRFHHRPVLAPLHAHRARSRPSFSRATAALSQHVPDVHVHHADGAVDQQSRHPLGRHGGGDADHCAARRSLPHAGGSGSGMEILYPVRRRHRPGAVWHHPHLLCRRTHARQRRTCAAMDASERRAHLARADDAVAGFCLFARRLRHQDRSGAAAQLAAGRPRRRADARFRRTFRPAAQCGALRHHPRQGARRRGAGHPLCGKPNDGLRPADRRRAGFLPLPPERHQAPVWLFFDRAHGADHVRLRDGRPGRQLRRPAAHDRAFVNQVGHFLRRRPCRTNGRHADHRRHPRPAQTLAHHWLGTHARHAGHSRHAAFRRIRQRIHDPDHRHPAAPLGGADSADCAGRCLRGHVP